MKYCPFCGWPEDEPYDVASRHRTTQGQTVWARCVCGSLQVRIVGAAGSRIVARSRPDADAGAGVTVPTDADCRS